MKGGAYESTPTINHLLEVSEHTQDTSTGMVDDIKSMDLTVSSQRVFMRSTDAKILQTIFLLSEHFRSTKYNFGALSEHHHRNTGSHRDGICVVRS